MFDSLRKKLSSFIGKVEEIEEVEVEKVEKVKKEEKATPSPPEEDKVTLTKITKVTKVKHVFKDTVKLSEKDLERILSDFQLELIQSDVAYETSEKIMDELKKRLLNKEIPKHAIKKYIKNSLRNVLLDILKTEKENEEEIDLLDLVKHSSKKPFKIIFFGVNGSGKTTTIAKVAHWLMKNSLSIVLAAGDTFRAGAIEQIEKHAQNLGLRVIKHKKGADSAAVIYDAVEHAKSKGIDVVLADTAGRSHTNVNLMDEMEKISRVNKPDLKIFVGDALTGNDAIDQVEMFDKGVGIDAVILTKMDADVKGGCVLSIINAIKKPILFIGVGQSYDDLVKFDKEWFINKILGEDGGEE
jgi:fused signal recognition particle receptor